MSLKIIFITGALFFLIIAPAASYAQQEGATQDTYFSYGFKEFGVFSGFQKGNLKQKGHYELIPAMFHFGFDLRPPLKIKTKFIIEFMFEPFINTVFKPDGNVEVGNNFLLKFAFPLTERLYPYFEGGLGLVYLSQHTREQSTQFNFTDQAGVGITYFLKNNLSLNLGYRFRHVSNASIKHPNSGINTDSAFIGISFLY